MVNYMQMEANLLKDIRCPICKKILFQSAREIEFGAKDSDSVIQCRGCKARINFKFSDFKTPRNGADGSSTGS